LVIVVDSISFQLPIAQLPISVAAASRGVLLDPKELRLLFKLSYLGVKVAIVWQLAVQLLVMGRLL